MLEGLDDLNWRTLLDKDVPVWIRGLASQDEETRQEAYGNLYKTHMFDGSVHYAGTPHVVPFLIELLGSETVQEKDGLLLMLVQLLTAALSMMDLVPDSHDATTIVEQIHGSKALYERFLGSEDRFERKNAELLLSYLSGDAIE